jgi:hypothetical protein
MGVLCCFFAQTMTCANDARHQEKPVRRRLWLRADELLVLDKELADCFGFPARFLSAFGKASDIGSVAVVSGFEMLGYPAHEKPAFLERSDGDS